MAWRWSVKKARKQRRQRNQLPCFKNRGQGRIVEARGYPEAQTSLLFNLSSLHVSSRTNTHTHTRTPAPYVFIASSSSSIKRTTYDPLLLSDHPTDFSSVGGGNARGRVGYGRKGGGVPSVIDTLTKLEEEKIKGADVTRQSSGSGQATTQLQSPKPLSPACTHIRKFWRTMHTKLGGGFSRWRRVEISLSFRVAMENGKLNSRDSFETRVSLCTPSRFSFRTLL